MIKTHEVRDIIENDLRLFEPSQNWKEFVLMETETENHDTIYVNFVEAVEGKWVDNKYKIKVERVCE